MLFGASVHGIESGCRCPKSCKAQQWFGRVSAEQCGRPCTRLRTSTVTPRSCDAPAARGSEWRGASAVGRRGPTPPVPGSAAATRTRTGYCAPASLPKPPAVALIAGNQRVASAPDSRVVDTRAAPATHRGARPGAPPNTDAAAAGPGELALHCMQVAHQLIPLRFVSSDGRPGRQPALGVGGNSP